MKSVFFRFLSVCVLFLYGYSQIISQDSLDYFSKNHLENSFNNFIKRSNVSQIHQNYSSSKFHDEKIKVEDIESEDDSSEQCPRGVNKYCYLKNFYAIHSHGNPFFYLKNQPYFFKKEPSILTSKRCVLFQVFRI